MRSLRRAAKYLIIAVLVLCAGDWCVFEARLSRGTGVASLPVDQYLKTPLKGGKEEYDYLGSGSQNCARALLPQYAASQWNPPCWWVARHGVRWQ